jgi:hypothetical protein
MEVKDMTDTVGVLIYALGDCDDFDAAEQVANDMGLVALWIADADTARQWMRTIEDRFEGVD